MKGREKKSETFSTILLNWVELMSYTSSIHGLSWFNYFDSYILKGMTLSFALCCICFLPTFTYVTWNNFLEDDSILTKVATKRLKEIKFPKLTVCHPLYFPVDLLHQSEYFHISQLFLFLFYVGW